MLNIAVFVSGGGTNFQALIDAEKSGIIKGGSIKLCLSSKNDVYALERAKQNNIPLCVLLKKDFTSQEKLDIAILNELENHKIDFIVLAGYLSILSETIINKYKNKIINVHPSLIPSFCGEGFYGIKVHEAALEYGVKITGATVHFVNEIADGGKIILQKAVEVHEGDTPEILQKRVMQEAEWEILPKAVSMYCNGLIK